MGRRGAFPAGPCAGRLASAIRAAKARVAEVAPPPARTPGKVADIAPIRPIDSQNIPAPRTRRRRAKLRPHRNTPGRRMQERAALAAVAPVAEEAHDDLAAVVDASHPAGRVALAVRVIDAR